MATFLIASIGVTVLGAALAYLGWRGRRVGDHPYCRRCGFDLFGRPEGSRACSECGADLSRRRAMVVGIRTRRRRVAWAGVTLLVPSGLALSLVGYGAAQGMDWQKAKPFWVLAREAEGADLNARDRAMGELSLRRSVGALSAGQLTDVIERGLRLQADGKRPWPIWWAGLIEDARWKGHVTDAQWKRYVEQAVAGRFSLRFRPRVSRGSRALYQIDFAGTRSWGSSMMLVTRIEAIEVAGVRIPHPTGGKDVAQFISNAPSSRGAAEEPLRPGQELWRDVPDGVHDATMIVKVAVTPNQDLDAALRARQATTGPSGRSNSAFARSRSWERSPVLEDLRTSRRPSLVNAELKLPFRFELVDADESAAIAVVDPSLRLEVRESVAVTRISLMGPQTMVEILPKRVPIDLCFDVIVRDASGEQTIGGAIFTRDGAQDQWFAKTSTPLRSKAQSPFRDVILRPSLALAGQTMDVVRYWGEEVVFEDVPVESSIEWMDRRERERRGRTSAGAK